MSETMKCERVMVGATPAMVCRSGAEGEYKIRVGLRWWRFEWHSYLGPCAIHKQTGREIKPSQAFLVAAGLWHEQGKRIDAEGFCVWEPEPVERVVHLIGRHYAVVPDGQTPEEVREKWLSIARKPR